MSLLAVGTVAFDALETPFGKTDKIIGGSATFITLAASYFTKKINLVAVVGDDFRKEDIRMMEEHGINTKGLQVKEGQKSFFWSGRYHNDMNSRDTLVTELNVLADYDLFQFKHKVKPDYCNAGGLRRFESDGEGGFAWFDVDDDEAD